MQKKRSDADARTPSGIDAEVGSRVRAARLEINMSQVALAEAVGVSFQQIQKYEKGLNRITASRLQAVAQALGKSVSFFLPKENERAESNSIYELFQVQGVAELGRELAKIQSPLVRQRLVSLMLTMAKEYKAGQRSDD